MKIYLDMDDVVADWMERAYEIVGRRWELGERIQLVPNAITTKNDINVVDKRNTMSAAFNRAVKNAKNIIANTARGEFPNSSPPSK